MGFQSLQQRLFPEVIRQLAAASVTSSTANPAWAQIGTTGLTDPSRVLIIQNFTDKTLSFSWDGSVIAGISGNINLQLPSNGQIVIDEATNGSPQTAAFTSVGTTFWVQYPNAAGAPATGSVNVSSIYAANSSSV